MFCAGEILQVLTGTVTVTIGMLVIATTMRATTWSTSRKGW